MLAAQDKIQDNRHAEHEHERVGLQTAALGAAQCPSKQFSAAMHCTHRTADDPAVDAVSYPRSEFLGAGNQDALIKFINVKAFTHGASKPAKAVRQGINRLAV